MRKTIAILELYQHDEVLRHYCDLLRVSTCNIKVFCSKVMYKNMRDFEGVNQVERNIKDEIFSIPKFQKSNFIKIKECDLVFITTALRV